MAMWLGSLVLLVAACAAELTSDAQCPPAQPRCLPTDQPDTFILNGRVHKIASSGTWLGTTCAAAALDDAAWPRFLRTRRFDQVNLLSCVPPPNSSYVEALQTLKIAVRDYLYLMDIPAGSRLHASWFEDLEQLISLHVSAGSVLRSEPGTFANLEVSSLTIDQVQADRVPSNLHILNIYNTGADHLPEGALDAELITVNETNLRSMAGSAPRMTRMMLYAPVVSLPNAPRVYRIALEDARPGELPSGFVAGSPGLEALTMRNFTLTKLPLEFLRGASRLTEFQAVSCGLTSLPEDLFQYTPKIMIVDLKNNKIESLPSGLFWGLREMYLLWLNGNRLHASDVRAVVPLTTLGNLQLDSNPLGDLCPPGESSMLLPLQNLKYLNLADTQATHLCPDYLRHLGALINLDLSNNSISSLPCSELHVPYAPYHFVKDVFLLGNPIHSVDCSREDYMRGGGEPKDKPIGRLVIDSKLKCDCTGYWLSRMLRERRVEVAFDPDFEKESCADDWLPCRPANEERVKITVDECGELTPKQVGLAIGGRWAERGELPWHAAVYRKENNTNEYICGGSLISKRVVVSAAHCFWKSGEKLSASRFAVALGKLHRPWDDPRDQDVQKSELSALRVPPRFLGRINMFQSDIALMILRETIVYQPHIAPICLDFGYLFESRQLKDGNLAKVAGWGFVSEDGAQTDLLQVVELPFVSVEECQASAPPAFTQFVTNDKICAGYRNGTAALCHGDSGGGLAFPVMYHEKLRFYLRGVVSTAPSNNKECNAYWLTTFTQLSKHVTFIFKVANEFKDRQIDSPTRRRMD